MGKYGNKITTKKEKFEIIVPAMIIILVIIAGGIYYWQSQQKPVLGGIHIHADFKVYLSGVAYNFSQDKYMSKNGQDLSPFIHIHDLNGNVIHQHISGVSLEDFFRSLGMNFSSSCFALDNGTSFCNQDGNTLKMYAKHNGSTWQPSNDFGNYRFQDLDKILITYGSETPDEIVGQEASVTDMACQYSDKCPEKGNLSENESDCISNGNDSGCSAG